MPYIDIEGAVPQGLDAYTNYQVYNTLDSAVTAQLLPVMKEELNDNTATTYKREMNVLALCLEMSSKGFPVDQMCLAELLWSLEKDAARSLSILHRLCDAVGFRAINPRSPKDVPDLFYGHMRVPEIWEHDRKTGTKKLAADIKALEKIKTNYPTCAPFVNAISAYREASKMASVFRRGLEPGTGNLRCNYSPSGTETGRLSSQQNPYGRGTNGQNLTDRVRQVVTAPEGFAILNFDLKTAESVAVGYISGDRAYIDACEGGDLHTSVCKLVWPELAWTGNRKADKAIAESPFYRHFSFRDQAKRGGHGSNYYGTARTLAAILNVPVAVVQNFQDLYFGAFPGIPEWHIETIRRIMQDGYIVTAMKRERRFWGRADDPATHREAIAFEPQSLVGDIMNEGLINVQSWIKRQLPEAKAMLGRGRKLLPFNPKVPDLRAQVHDAGVFVVPIDGIADITREITELLKVPVNFPGVGTMLIENDVMVGKRWCKQPKPNSKNWNDGKRREGLADYVPGDQLHWL